MRPFGLLCISCEPVWDSASAPFCVCRARFAQQYDLVLRGGRVIDPANNIDRAMDVAVAGDRIAAVAAQIADQQARKTGRCLGHDRVARPGRSARARLRLRGHRCRRTIRRCRPERRRSSTRAAADGAPSIEFRRTVIAHSAHEYSGAAQYRRRRNGWRAGREQRRRHGSGGDCRRRFCRIAM